MMSDMILPGYIPGSIGRLVELDANYYHPDWGFGLFFQARGGPTQEVKDPWGNFRRGATGTARINRKDFGLARNRAFETGGVVVGEDVDIIVEIELMKKWSPHGLKPVAPHMLRRAEPSEAYPTTLV